MVELWPLCLDLFLLFLVAIFILRAGLVGLVLSCLSKSCVAIAFTRRHRLFESDPVAGSGAVGTCVSANRPPPHHIGHTHTLASVRSGAGQHRDRAECAPPQWGPISHHTAAPSPYAHGPHRHSPTRQHRHTLDGPARFDRVRRSYREGRARAEREIWDVDNSTVRLGGKGRGKKRRMNLTSFRRRRSGQWPRPVGLVVPQCLHHSRSGSPAPSLRLPRLPSWLVH